MAGWHDNDLVHKQREAMNMAAQSPINARGLQNQLAPPPPETPVFMALSSLRGVASSLECLLENLEMKLDPVMISLPEDPMKEMGQGIPTPMSAIEMEIRTIEARLRLLARKADIIISRLQV